MYDNWTLASFLDKLELVDLLESPEQGRILGEITEKQRKIFQSFEVTPHR